MAASKVENDSSCTDLFKNVIENLERKDDDDLIRQVLEKHSTKILSSVAMEKQAYAWLQWARHRDHLKVKYRLFVVMMSVVY